MSMRFDIKEGEYTSKIYTLVSNNQFKFFKFIFNK
jgi:hypothetical protein